MPENNPFFAANPGLYTPYTGFSAGEAVQEAQGNNSLFAANPGSVTSPLLYDAGYGDEGNFFSNVDFRGAPGAGFDFDIGDLGNWASRKATDFGNAARSAIDNPSASFIGGGIGTLASMASGVPGWGIAGSAIGNIADISEANKGLETLGAETLGFVDYLGGVGNSVTFGLGPFSSIAEAAARNRGKYYGLADETQAFVEKPAFSFADRASASFADRVSAAQTAYDMRIANSTSETVDPSTDFETWDDWSNNISVQDKANKERDDAMADAAATQAEADYEAEVSENEEDDEGSNEDPGEDDGAGAGSAGKAHGGFVTGNPDDDAWASGNPGSSNVKEPDLGNLTVSEFLLRFPRVGYTGRGRLSLGPEQGAVSAALVPKNPDLPEVSMKATKDFGGTNQPGTGSLSVGSKLLRYTREKEGSRTTDTVEGGAGPARGFYQQSSQPGNRDPRTTAYGGELNLGPVQLYGQRNQSSQDIVDPRFAQYFQNTLFDQKTDTIGARGSWPVGQGTLSADINRQYGTGRFPQHISQDARPTGRNPNVTNYSAGYEGRVGPGLLGLQGNLTDVRNRGTDKSIRGSYEIGDPFGLGGDLSATGSYNNPIGGKSAAEALFRYKLKF